MPEPTPLRPTRPDRAPARGAPVALRQGRRASTRAPKGASTRDGNGRTNANGAGRSGGGNGSGPTRYAPRPRRRPGKDGPRLRKLRFVLILAGLSALALVSTIFGMMMAVASDLPALENQ